MIPPAKSNFETSNDSGQRARLTPTSLDLVSPFASLMEHTPEQKERSPRALEISDDLSIPLEPLDPYLTGDPPTVLVPRARFRTLPPGTIVGESYEIGGRLGAGAMGEVYAARHTGLGKRVAIKVIGQRLSEDDHAIGRFITEARTLAQIQHPAIVTVEHVGELPDGRAYFVMEYLRGESLSERLSRGRVPLREALRILDQMARGLDAAHQSGVTHRDLKPDNVFLVHLAGEKPAVKLLDFGLAKLTTDEPLYQGVVMGTPLYMSPEQVHGLDVDHRADIYALGCVAYELILGVRPFPQAQTTPMIYAAHLYETPPSPKTIWPEIASQLDRLLFAMLAKDPAHRPSLIQVRSVVTRLRASTPSQQTPTVRVTPRPLKPRKYSRPLIAIAALCALATGASIGVAFSSTLNTKGRSAPSDPQIQGPPATPSASAEKSKQPSTSTPKTPETTPPSPVFLPAKI